MSPRPNSGHRRHPVGPLLPAVSAVALVLAAAPALAQVTAEQVWADWKAALELGGATVTVAEETYADGVLTVTGLAHDLTEENGSRFSGTLDRVVFTENGDGSVTVTMAPDYMMAFSAPADPASGTPATELNLAMRQPDLVTTVTGSPDALTYDFSAPRLSFELVSVQQDGVELPGEALLTLNGLTGRYTSTGSAAEDRSIDAAIGAESMDLLIDMQDATTGDHVLFSGKVEGMAAQGALVLPAAAMESPDTALMDGLTMDGGYRYDSAAYLFDLSDSETGTANGSISTGAGSLEASLSAQAVRYETHVADVSLQVTGASLPFPVSADLAEYGIRFAMPLSRTEAPAPWALGLNLTGLAINEEIWALLDPAGTLPRDPATLHLDLTGTATLLVDLVDPAKTAQMTEMPGRIDSVSLDTLRLAFGGAEVTGSGAAEIDNTDLTTYEGFPKPVGMIEMTLNGVNGLIEKLASLGLLTQDELMGARMMLGLLATPVGEDQLESRIEFTADGQILANGQRLR